jgi:D-alanyl-D-alanine carboxypeptidase
MLAPEGSPGSLLFREPPGADAGDTMRLHPRSVILAAALIAPAAGFTAACGDSGSAAPAPAAKPAASRTTTPASTAAHPALTSQLRSVVAAGSPGVIALVNEGHAVRLHAAGVADTRSGRALRADDRFRAASITKSFVATVALQLVGEGKLALTDTVERRLPGVLPYGETVTLRQLLNHTAGVPDMHEPVVALEQYTGDVTRSWSPRELVASVAGKKPDFAAGTSWRYSNTGYVLAGLMIERAAGDSLGHELERRIFGPLHLDHTSFPSTASAIAGSHANGYGQLDGKLTDVTALNPSGAWAAGALVSSAPDIAHFWRGLLGGELLEPAQLDAMKSTVPMEKGYPASYGLGIMRFESACGPVWGNGGDIAGYSSLFQNSEDGKQQAGVIVNVNPIPKAVDGPFGAIKQSTISTALGNGNPC